MFFQAVASPPLDGSISVIPGFIDFQAQNNGERPWVVFPAGTPVESVSYAQYSEATQRVAWALRPDGTRANGEIVAVIVHCDTILYLALLSGLVRAGFIPFPMSPKNSVPAFANMLKKTDCHHIITQPVFDPVISGIKSEIASDQFQIRVDELPGLHDIFPQFSGNPGALRTQTFSPPSKPHSADDIVLYLHSSGSTGFPKPVPQRQKAVLEWCISSPISDTRKHGVVWGSMPLPTFHTMGLYMQFYTPLATGFPVGLYYPMAPAPPVAPSPLNIIEACKGANVTGVAIVPALIEAWAQSEDTIRYLATLDILAYAGGPLSKTSGNKLVAAGVRLCCVYGGTEYGVHTKILDTDYSLGPEASSRTKEDWEWVSFPDYPKCRWIPQGDGTYELQFLTCEGHTPAIENLPDARGYATSDLFVPHPTKKGLWKITGRKDDVIVLGTGEKVVPIPQEGLIASSPMVSGVVVFGRAKNTCGVLIEPRPEFTVDPGNLGALVDFRNKIWPAVEKGNAIAPSFARIFKEMIIVTSPDKPLPRAAKGTVIRFQTIQLYSEEINELYKTVDNSADTRGIAPPASWSVEDIEPWLISHAASINNGTEISPSRDMFDQGFDSLHATFLRNRIIGTMRASQDLDVQQATARVSQNFVFDHPSLRALASAVAGTILSKAPVSEQDTLKEISQMLDHYVRHIPTPEVVSSIASSADIVILLTGSTGNIGSHILAALLREPRVKRVYALNRGSDIRARQAVTFDNRGLSTDLLSDAKYVPLSGDVTVEGFGLDSIALKELKDNVTHVIHNAWRVDFNLSLPSFDKYVASTSQLVDFCALFSHSVKLYFTSSIAAAAGWDISRGPVPEVALDDPKAAAANGYGASKFVAENILSKAAKNGLQAVSLRIGQVCGSKTTGAWATSEWVPIVIKSSVALGMLPALDGVVSWIPVDVVIASLIDLVTSDRPLPELVNIVHPHPTEWHVVFECINGRLGQQPLRMVPFKDWLHAVEAVAAAERPEDLERVPAVKILQFLQGIAASEARAAATQGELFVEAGGVPTYDTANLRRLSPSTDTLEPLGELHARAWVDYWKKKGFLNL
ncbi:uncharacterized protein PHACADRAFT_260612 [Phanerochaete carnosa HHB-10118-sp]|uniref:Carrier domain-containing protein n=1 Tax=Phanerochaete carnosa (strain HHB-10118-sp) TaxID=650164 RepID=K5VZS4_PHACS|nr:uncharacterized protein PHACADRAFT_260612 [Phanerochaete carnosa HHB-10118-sp]EKM52305.1 hypothetical protein PHACADRAFT_260612 [Phanerochaete carnosa HHB-10118-sp]